MFNLYVISAPVFVLIFFIEFILALIHNREKDLLKDMKVNLFLAFCGLLTGLLGKGLAFGLYSLLYSVSLFSPAVSWQLWVIAFFLCDFAHYYYHWLGHHTRLFWAGHVTHHSSVYYNFSIGLRINSIHVLYRFIFWAPLCFLGIPPEMILFFESLTNIWNFFLHTEKVKKLGVLEWVFNTPSNHRVHHASNPEYLDKNLGGILIIYDHLFGTYKKETTRVVYGITKNINTHNPFKILLDEYAHVFRHVSKYKGIKEKLNYLFSKPESDIINVAYKNTGENQPDYSPVKEAV